MEKETSRVTREIKRRMRYDLYYSGPLGETLSYYYIARHGGWRLESSVESFRLVTGSLMSKYEQMVGCRNHAQHRCAAQPDSHNKGKATRAKARIDGDQATALGCTASSKDPVKRCPGTVLGTA